MCGANNSGLEREKRVEFTPTLKRLDFYANIRIYRWQLFSLLKKKKKKWLLIIVLVFEQPKGKRRRTYQKTTCGFNRTPNQTSKIDCSLTREQRRVNRNICTEFESDRVGQTQYRTVKNLSRSETQDFTGSVGGARHFDKNVLKCAGVRVVRYTPNDAKQTFDETSCAQERVEKKSMFQQRPSS